jgi:pimeloyl-ACP methyl ester carboxylesterase
MGSDAVLGSMMRSAIWVAVLVAAAGAQRNAAPPPYEGHSVLPGVRLFYTDTGGTGIPIVLMHAATGSVRAWEHQTAVFVKAGYRVIAFDRRGWGRTEIDTQSPAATAADDLVALMDSLHIDRFHLVGTAAGGFVTIDTALSFPKRLRSIVVANSIGGVQDDDFVALGRRLRPAEFLAMPPEIREVSPSYRAGNPGGTRQWVELEHVSRPPGPAAPAQPLKNKITFALLETIAVPTLLLTGDADMYAPPPVLKMFAARIKHAESLIVPEAGHSTYWEQPDIFNRAVLNFIRKH